MSHRPQLLGGFSPTGCVPRGLFPLNQAWRFNSWAESPNQSSALLKPARRAYSVLRLGGKAVTVRVEITRPGVGIVCGLQPFGPGPGVAEGSRVAPTNLLHRVARSLPKRRVFARQLLIDLLSHRVFVDGERADLDPVESLVRFVLVGGAHLERTGRDGDYFDPAAGRHGPRLPAGFLRRRAATAQQRGAAKDKETDTLVHRWSDSSGGSQS